MKRTIVQAVVVSCVAVFAAKPAFSQVTVQAGGGIGVMTPLSDYSGTTIEYYAGQTYGLSSGLNLVGKLRAGVQSFVLVGELGLAFLSNSGNSEPGQGNVEVSQTVLTFRIGPEYHFKIPSMPAKPYLGANLALHQFSGETKFQGVSRVPSATFSVESSSRFGIGFGGGVLVAISPTIDLDFGLGLNFMNLGGSEWLDVNLSQDERLDAYLALNDLKDPLFDITDDKHFVADDRSISSFQIIVSILFGL